MEEKLWNNNLLLRKKFYPNWDKRKKIKGTKYYYQEKIGSQYLDWEDTKKELELEIEYKGEDKLAKSEIVKIASSIKLEI